MVREHICAMTFTAISFTHICVCVWCYLLFVYDIFWCYFVYERDYLEYIDDTQLTDDVPTCKVALPLWLLSSKTEVLCSGSRHSLSQVH